MLTFELNVLKINFKVTIVNFIDEAGNERIWNARTLFDD